MLGMSGLLNLLSWVEHRQQAQNAVHEEGDALCPVSHVTPSPPPDSRQAIGWWTDLPQINRQQLLWLLSHLLERQLEQRLAPDKEGSDERDNCVE